MALMATTYIAGALIYGCRFPERIMPGKFNFFVSVTHKKWRKYCIKFLNYRALLTKSFTSVLQLQSLLIISVL